MINFICRSKTLLDTIPIPVYVPTGAVFGGPDLKTLFVTTAYQSIQEIDGSIYTDTVNPLAGALFTVTGLDTEGFPGRKMRVSPQTCCDT